MPRTAGPRGVARWVGLGYAIVGFVVTHAVFGALILALLDWVAWPSIDNGPPPSLAVALPLDLALIALFGLQHSGMARTAIKRLCARLLPAPLERATYVWFANVALALLVFAWRPLPITVWTVSAAWAVWAIWGVFAVGWGLAAIGSLLIDHLQLLGLSQAWSWFRGRSYEIKPFQRHWLYERVRHPIQLGLILAFWATPHMTVGHLMFAAGLTLYIVIATRLEERDLITAFGADYADYRARVPGLVPRLWR
jgi:protein-S-isoprenylcysteine O-methyltransferase Ste14